MFLVYALKKGKIELVYIGRSGKIEKDGTLFIRTAGLGGIKDRIINGAPFGNKPDYFKWKETMILEEIEALDVYWYVTHNDEYIDCPRIVKHDLFIKHLAIFGKLPAWNEPKEGPQYWLPF